MYKDEDIYKSYLITFEQEWGFSSGFTSMREFIDSFYYDNNGGDIYKQLSDFKNVNCDSWLKNLNKLHNKRQFKEDFLKYID